MTIKLTLVFFLKYFSASQVGKKIPIRTFRPDSIRLRTVDEITRRRFDEEIGDEFGDRTRALSTPRNRGPREEFPQTPTRIFKGEFFDASK